MVGSISAARPRPHTDRQFDRHPERGGAVQLYSDGDRCHGCKQQRRRRPHREDFALTQPSPITLIQGGASASFTIATSSLNGLSGQLSFTANSPQGIGLQFSPAATTIGGSTTVTLSAPASAPTITSAYNTTLLVTATYNSQGQQDIKTIPVQITVTPYPTYTISQPSLTPCFSRTSETT